MSHLNQTWIPPPDFSLQKFHDNPNSRKAAARWQTDRHDVATSPLSQICHQDYHDNMLFWNTVNLRGEFV